MSFLPQEPYRMPGYTGFIPGQGEHIEITRAALSKDKSNNLTHADYHEQIQDFQSRSTKNRAEYERLASSTRGIPGWTGYVPRKPFTHGSESFATSQAKCITDFSTTTTDRNTRNTEIMEATAKQPSLHSIIDHQIKPYPKRVHDLDRQGLATAGSCRENWRKAGYTGYVPGTISGNVFGMPVQRRNDHSKRVFEQDLDLLKRSSKNDIRPFSVSTERPTKFKQGGVIPRYQGYVPGRDYRFGESLSRDAAKVVVEKQVVRMQV